MDSDELARNLQALAEEVDKHVGWLRVDEQLPPEGVEVNTKIDDGLGIRNVQTLVRKGRLWFTPDWTMHVFYEPTHWKPIKETNDAT